MSPLFLGQLKNLHKSCLLSFKKAMTEGMRVEGYSFADVVASVRKTAEGRFTEGAKEAKLEDTDWVWEDELDLLREEIQTIADQCRADETKKMVNLIEVSSRSTISLFLGKTKNMGISETSSEASQNLWSFTSTRQLLTCGIRSSRRSGKRYKKPKTLTSPRPRVRFTFITIISVD